MREAVHCIGALLILTGCLGMTWMCLQLSHSIEQAFHGSNRVNKQVMVGKAKAAVKQSPFVLMPEVSSAGDY
jgi:hypothetical protein